MSLTFHYPAAPLNSYITRLYCIEGAMPYQRSKILPLPSLDFKINLGGAVQVYDAASGQPFANCTDSWCVGVWNAAHNIQWPSDLQIFVVEFKPGGAYPFLSLPLSELHNDLLSLDMVWGQDAANIRDQLYAARDVTARFALLERLLLARLCEAPPHLKLVQYAVSQIAEHHGVLSIRSLSDRLGISHKHLIDQFKRLVGTTPKELARLYRFQHVLGSIKSMQSVDWTWVAHQCCYYDQAHFNKEFEALTGHNPTAYLRLRHRLQTENPDHARYLRQLPTG